MIENVENSALSNIVHFFFLCESLLVVISCHGKMQKRTGLNLVGSCCGYVTLEALQEAASSAPVFRKCPKIFITNCCRGDYQIQTDGDAFQFRNIATDVYTSYATVEGYTASRHVENGSLYAVLSHFFSI